MYEKVKKIINNGDVEGACDIIKVNSDAFMEQLELSVEGIQHAAMLDIMAQLHLTLGDFEKNGISPSRGFFPTHGYFMTRCFGL
jgi:hypothetical protein